MIELIRTIARSLVSAAKVRRSLALENLALRHQVMVLQRQSKKPQLKNTDRLFWLGLRRVWAGWKSSLLIVQPATVVKWHRSGFKRYWRFKSRPKGGRPKIDPEVRKLIRDMWNMNPTWGRPRIQAELAKLGITVSDSTVARYKPRHRKPPSQSWRTFLDNHEEDIAAVDIFTVPTATFRVLYVFAGHVPRQAQDHPFQCHRLAFGRVGCSSAS